MTAGREDAVSVAEIAALTARLCALSAAGADADRAEREAFLADKQALLDRIALDQAAEADAEPAADHGPAGRWVPADDDSDGWVSEGYEAAHQAHLDALVHADAAAGVDRASTGGGRDVEEEARREQLARWHRDDHRPGGRDAVHEYGADEAAGWSR